MLVVWKAAATSKKTITSSSTTAMVPSPQKYRDPGPIVQRMLLLGLFVVASATGIGLVIHLTTPTTRNDLSTDAISPVVGWSHLSPDLQNGTTNRSPSAKPIHAPSLRAFSYNMSSNIPATTRPPVLDPIIGGNASTTTSNNILIVDSSPSKDVRFGSGGTAAASSPFPGKKGICLTLREAGAKGSYVENLPKLRALAPQWCYSWSTRPALEMSVLVVPPHNAAGIGRPKVLLATDDDDDGGTESNEHSWQQNQVSDGASAATKTTSTSAIEFVPMLWGYYPDKFEANLKEIRQQRPGVVLGFNEPDSAQQSNLSVDTAIEAWSEMVVSLTTADNSSSENSMFFVSPSCKNSLGTWCRSFLDKTTSAAPNDGLRVDAIGVHHYGGVSADAFREKLRTIYEIWKKPIVVTEFAVADWTATSVETNRYSPDEVLVFLEEVLPWMESTDWILGYAWFSFAADDPRGASSALFAEPMSGSNGSHEEPRLTPLGEFYARFRSPEF